MSTQKANPMTEPNRRTRSRPRKARRQPSLSWLKMSSKQPTNPVAPYDWATEEKLDKIHEASMWILENVGMAFMDPQALDIWEKAGAKVDHKAERVWIDRGLLMETVALAPSEFTWHARNPEHNLVIGGNRLAFTPNSGMPYVLDGDGTRRNSTLEDFTKFVKLAHTIPFFHLAGGPFVEPQEIPVSHRHLERMRVMLTATDKAVRDVAHGYVIPEDEVAMAKIAFSDQLQGGELPGACIGGTINVTSPLRLDDRMIGGIIAYARHGQVTFNTPFIMAGATSPATIASALAQQNAEALGAIALAQLVNPGAPVIYGGFTQNVDMRSGSPAFGGPEGAWGLLVGAQLARRYGLPYRSSNVNAANAVDAQAGYESVFSLWGAVMGGANLVFHGAGWMEGGLRASFEKMVLDADLLQMVASFLQPLTVDDASMAVEAIAEVGPGGHFFGVQHTQDRYRDAFFAPMISDWRNYESWAEAGSPTADQKAGELCRTLLAQYTEPPLDDQVRQELAEFVDRRVAEGGVATDY